MIHILYPRFLAWSALLFFMVFAGCASTGPTKFYTLSSTAAPQQLSDSRNLSIEIGPVEIPDYLDRPHLVTRSGRNELMVSDFYRWAGSLRDDISRVLVEDLSVLLSTDDVYMYPWANSLPVHYHVRITVNRFEGTPGGQVVLKAYWSVYGEGGSTLLIQNSSHIIEETGSTYAAVVAAMSRAVEKLGREIADAIMSLSGR